MVDVTDLLSVNTTKGIIDAREETDFPRGYSGMSGAGHSCLRFRQYQNKWAFKSTIPARVNRIFRLGHLFEQIVLEDLKDIGYELWGDQTRMSLLDNYLVGHNDGYVRGLIEAPKTDHVLEIKTMADKYYKDIVKKGVKISKPIYYTQMQLYMHCSHMTRALFVAINKNDCNYYIERIYYDKDHVDFIVNREQTAIFSPVLEDRIGGSSWYECSYCDAKEVCHFGAMPEKSCRSCTGFSILGDGKFGCGKKELTIEEQKKGCDHYHLSEMFRV